MQYEGGAHVVRSWGSCNFNWPGCQHEAHLTGSGGLRYMKVAPIQTDCRAHATVMRSSHDDDLIELPHQANQQTSHGLIKGLT